MDPQATAAQMMKDPKFLEMFQKALGEGGKIPDEKDPNRDKWLKEMQEKLAAEAQREAKKQLEQPVSDKDGQWMYIIPEPGFCIKCSTYKGGKIFINLCKHERIAEPIPLDPEEQEEDDAIKFKIPLSCGQRRADKDKSGNACLVYDVIVNPNTLQKCSEDAEFRRFVAALCMTWIKQKSEPDLNADEFKNVNFKCKGVPEAQRIRLSHEQKPANALGDEINLPGKNSPTAPLHVGGRGTGPLIQEVDASADKKAPAPAKPVPTYTITPEGSYDWAAHQRAARNPHFRESVPSLFHVQIVIPGIQTIKEVDVQVVKGKSLELTYVDEEGKPFLQIPLQFTVQDEPVSAKFVKSKSELKISLKVALPDETDTSNKTKASRDAEEIEREEREKAEAEHERRLQEHRARIDRQQQHEKDIMNQRKEYVENINAIQEGEIPPVVKEEFDAMSSQQLTAILPRLENRIKRGDSVDTLLEKLPPEVIGSICRFIRSKLGLVEPPASSKDKEKKKVSFNEAANSVSQPVAAPAATPIPTGPDSGKSTWDKQLEDPVSVANVEYNFAKKAEKMFGVLMNNRYLFALDH